jgi:hypothetical protein
MKPIITPAECMAPFLRQGSPSSDWNREPDANTLFACFGCEYEMAVVSQINRGLSVPVASRSDVTISSLSACTISELVSNVRTALYQWRNDRECHLDVQGK